MTKISCQVCLDLMPLVKDNVASQESRKLVFEHIRQCQGCKNEYESGNYTLPEMNDKRVIQKIKKQLYLIALATVIIGTLIGIGLSEGPGMFYNIIIFPLVGGIAYFALNRKSFYFPIAIFILSYIWSLINYIIDRSFPIDSVFNLLYAPVFLSCIYSGLVLFGIVIAFLLKFAFRKEVDYEKDN
ncbi:MAG: hypothetical protein WBI74_05055 [Caldicoprobacterales bacterium]|jgi:hypothetical protein|nr:zf-HC2 domain-containing protein [Clostridiales bacterium]